MKKSVKKFLINTSIIIAIIIISLLILKKPTTKIDQETTICIGQNSVLFIQKGCHACEAQEEIFGENFQYLNVVDCWDEPQNCNEIKFTPTWKFKNNSEKYTGVQSIENLLELTRC